MIILLLLTLGSDLLLLTLGSDLLLLTLGSDLLLLTLGSDIIKLSLTCQPSEADIKEMTSYQLSLRDITIVTS